jgi:hypothetical protein
MSDMHSPVHFQLGFTYMVESLIEIIFTVGIVVDCSLKLELVAGPFSRWSGILFSFGDMVGWQT